MTPGTLSVSHAHAMLHVSLLVLATADDDS
jgi:hypothetical protein